MARVNSCPDTTFLRLTSSYLRTRSMHRSIRYSCHKKPVLYHGTSLLVPLPDPTKSGFSPRCCITAQAYSCHKKPLLYHGTSLLVPFPEPTKDGALAPGVLYHGPSLVVPQEPVLYHGTSLLVPLPNRQRWGFSPRC